MLPAMTVGPAECGLRSRSASVCCAVRLGRVSGDPPLSLNLAHAACARLWPACSCQLSDVIAAIIQSRLASRSAGPYVTLPARRNALAGLGVYPGEGLAKASSPAITFCDCCYAHEERVGLVRRAVANVPNARG
jgi:hypothetical protein